MCSDLYTLFRCIYPVLRIVFILHHGFDGRKSVQICAEYIIYTGYVIRQMIKKQAIYQFNDGMQFVGIKLKGVKELDKC